MDRSLLSSFSSFLLVLALVTATPRAAAGETPPASDAAAHPTDGRLFDPGLAMTAPAEGASAELARMAGFVGAWELTVERPAGDEAPPATAHGRALVTFMNRGHALMERTRIDDFERGAPRATVSFLAVSPLHGTWTFGEADSRREAILTASGGFNDKTSSLVLHDAGRPRGGWGLELLRRSYSVSSDAAHVTIEASADLGATWQLVERRRYRRVDDPSADFFPVRDDFGAPSARRPPEAAEFDFLVGEYDARHWRRAPDGSEGRWRSHATAVHVLDGQAVLEFDSFDADPSLPDAATSILRLYNRAERRWESLFLTNRQSSNLFFGGVREGEEIVLHFFDTDSTDPMSRWIFFDIEADTYRWKGLSSTDGGASFQPTWTIDFRRVGLPDTPKPTSR
ncbi:MAG: hypothetical protein AAGC60_27765 [Acidobacteriota bacterium]